jgi:hypothetical protein
LVDEGKSSLHKDGGERTEDGRWRGMCFYFGRELRKGEEGKMKREEG